MGFTQVLGFIPDYDNPQPIAATGDHVIGRIVDTDGRRLTAAQVPVLFTQIPEVPMVIRCKGRLAVLAQTAPLTYIDCGYEFEAPENVIVSGDK